MVPRIFWSAVAEGASGVVKPQCLDPDGCLVRNRKLFDTVKIEISGAKEQSGSLGVVRTM